MKQGGGLIIRSGDEPIERVESKSTTIDLVAQGDGTELWRQHVKAGGRIGLGPVDGWSGLEAFHVIEGEFQCELGGETVLVRAGDTVSTINLTEPTIFSARTDTSILYVCSRPSFHFVSRQVQELMELAVTIEEVDKYTAGHCKRIRDLSVLVGKALQLSPTKIDTLMFGSFLHDVGKAKIPVEILNKEGELDADEWLIMRRHPIIGREMVEGTSIESAGPIIEQHHERLDGSGYPYGLQGDEILIEAQIVGVVDSFDAMTTDRPYRRALPVEVALEELRRGVGRLYSREVVEALSAVTRAGS